MTTFNVETAENAETRPISAASSFGALRMTLSRVEGSANSALIVVTASVGQALEGVPEKR